MKQTHEIVDVEGFSNVNYALYAFSANDDTMDKGVEHFKRLYPDVAHLVIERIYTGMLPVKRGSSKKHKTYMLVAIVPKEAVESAINRKRSSGSISSNPGVQASDGILPANSEANSRNVRHSDLQSRAQTQATRGISTDQKDLDWSQGAMFQDSW